MTFDNFVTIISAVVTIGCYIYLRVTNAIW
jgi:hypothetical protein